MGPSFAERASDPGFPCLDYQTLWQGSHDLPAETVCPLTQGQEVNFCWFYRLSKRWKIVSNQHYATKESLQRSPDSGWDQSLAVCRHDPARFPHRLSRCCLLWSGKVYYIWWNWVFRNSRFFIETFRNTMKPSLSYGVSAVLRIFYLRRRTYLKSWNAPSTNIWLDCIRSPVGRRTKPASNFWPS